MTTPNFAKPATGPDAALRAGDADRNAAIERLGDALAEGALDTGEYNRRLEHASTAVTMDQLAALTADLPVSQAALTRAENARAAEQKAADRREWAGEWSYWGAGALIMTVIWVVQCVRAGDLEWFWPAAPLGIWAAVLASYAIWPDAKDKHRRLTRH